MPVQSDRMADSYARAFADAQAGIQSRMNRALEKARAEAKATERRYVGFPGVAAYLPWETDWGTDWWAVAAEIRSVAEKLAKDQGKGITPYLQDHVDESPFLALLTLDVLEKHSEAAQAFFGLIPKRHGDTAFLWVSFCSAKTRAAAANRLVANMPTRQPAFGDVWSLARQANFVAMTGNADTLELLERVANTPERGTWKIVLERAIKRLRFRLSLPKKEQEQRAQDELLFWQTAVGAPIPCNVTSGRVFAAKCLAVQKLTISSAYLIEQLEQAEPVTGLGGALSNQSDGNFDKQLVPNRARLALLILANQKDNDAVPAMANLVRRIPSFRNDVESTLEQFDTPEAKKAIRDLPIASH